MDKTKVAVIGFSRVAQVFHLPNIIKINQILIVKKILLVDDEPDIVEFLKYNLEQQNFEVLVGYNGIEALKKVKQNPDLIILDIMMDGMNGFEVCEKIKANPKYENIPIIFLTAKAGEVDEIKGLKIGASDYIQKPISPKKLII